MGVPNASETKLIVKHKYLNFAERVFSGSGLTILTEEHKYLI